MSKGIRYATALVFSISFFLMGSQSAGQGTVQQTTQLPQKQLYFTQKELPKDFTIKEVEKGQQEGNTGDTGAKQLKPKTVEKEQPYKELTVTATAYVSFCDTGCIGITATGTNVKNSIYHPSGMKIVAVDPNVIPLGSIVEINGEKYIADDTGGAIKGHKIDILVDTHDTSKAFAFGKQTLNIKVLH